MSMIDYIIRPFDIEQDCEKLAEMWNNSDAEWPGTWTGGVPMTPQQIRTWHERMKKLDIFVWDTGDKIAGYCSLTRNEDEPQMIYLPLLNVSPEFQGQSLGRKFLTYCVDRVVELKKTRLDLDTWSGNLKAVPLYKRTGFFWKPGQYEQLLNFMPGILQMSCAKPYFEKHDWYRTLQRELTQEPDDEHWEGMHVFTYRFVAGLDELTVWADREARTITAVDTERLFAAAIAEDINPIKGYSTNMRWRLTNKWDIPIDVLLMASGTKDLILDYRTSRRIEPGDTLELEAPVEISETADTPDMSKPAPAIKTLLLIDDEPLELATGIRPRANMELSVYPDNISLLPGVPQTVHLRFRSHFSQDVEASVSLGASEGLITDWNQQGVVLPAQGYAGLPVVLKAEKGGVFDLSVSTRFEVDGKTKNLPADTQTIFAGPLGGLLSKQTGKSIRIENDIVRMNVDAKGGSVSISDRVTGKGLISHDARPIPPVWPSEFKDKEYALTLEHENGMVVITATYKSEEYSGFVFRKTVRMNAGSLIAIDHTFDNVGMDSHTFQLCQFIANRDENNTTLTIPFREGIVQGPCERFPGIPDDVFDTSPVYAEQWAAFEYGHTTVGLFWPDDVKELGWKWETELVTGACECSPQSRHHAGTLHLYVGDGDWRSVQRVWQRMSGKKTHPFESESQSAEVLHARIDPPVVATIQDHTTASLHVAHPITLKCEGTATLKLPDGWQSEKTTFEFTGLNWQQPFDHTLALSNSVAPGAYHGQILLHSQVYDTELTVPLIRLGDSREVMVQSQDITGHRVWTIANGRLEIDVIPSFSATVSAIRKNGVNHVSCGFPETGVMGAYYPWYGGIMPMIHSSRVLYPGIIHKEQFEGEQVMHTDKRGINWFGVRQTSNLIDQDNKGLILEIDTLTVGNSPIVKQIFRFRNTTSSFRQVQAGWIAFVQPDGDRRKTVLWSQDYAYKRGDRTPSIQNGHWAAAENPDTGRSIALISPVPQVCLDDWGKDGGHLKLRPDLTIEPNKILEMVAYVVVADDRTAIRRFAALKDLV